MTFRNRLEAQTKDRLLEVRSLFEVDVPSSSRKADLIDAIERHFLTRTEDVLRLLPEYELRLLQGLSHLPKGHTYTFAFPHTPYFLALFDLVESSYDPETRETSISIDDDLREAVAGCIDSVVIGYELDGGFEAEMVFFGMLTVYGVVEMKDLMDLIEENYSPERAGAIYRRLVLYAPFRFFKSGTRLCHPALGNPDDLVKDREKRGFASLKKVPLKEIKDAGMTTPYFASDMKAPHGKALLEALRSAGFDEEALPFVVSDIWRENQFSGDAKGVTRMVKSILEGGRFSSHEDAERCIGAIMDYSNHIPKWFLGGRSSAEVGTGGGTIPGMAANLNATAEKLASIYSGASRFPKVGRNDPCPCGSGLKYKNCHGKNQS